MHHLSFFPPPAGVQKSQPVAIKKLQSKKAIVADLLAGPTQPFPLKVAIQKSLAFLVQIDSTLAVGFRVAPD